MQLSSTTDATIRTRSQQRRDTRKQKEVFSKAYAAEHRYKAQLKKIAKHVGELVKAFDPTDIEAMKLLRQLLINYAKAIEPWANKVASNMLTDVAIRDEKAWNAYTKGMAEGIRLEVQNAPVGEVFRELMATQVGLITSLPLEAANRVHELAIRNLSEGSRDNNILKMILDTGLVTESRAKVIARTETARAASNFTQARARYVGSEGYIWRTSLDPEVRLTHRLLEGKFFTWDNPPICDLPNKRAHPGCIYNCRCFPEVVLPNVMRPNLYENTNPWFEPIKVE